MDTIPRSILAVAVAAGVADLLLLGVIISPARSTMTITPTPPPSVAYPTSPPAEVCGNATLLNGPPTQPPGSVRVDPGGIGLDDATLTYPPGTTFWLAAGTHTLGSDQFAQVIPKDGNVYLGAPGATLDGQGLNRYAFTQRATDVTIRYLTIQNFVSPRDEGVVNHDGASGWTIEHNTVRLNGGAGVFAGNNNVVRYNCLTENSQYGFQGFAAGGASGLTIDHNEISYNNTGDWETVVPGCGCTGGGKFWDVNGADVTNNWVHHNKGVGLWADTNDLDFRFEGNYINDNDAEGILYEISYNALIRNNVLSRNALVKGASFAERNDPFPVGAIYLSESGGEGRVPSRYSTLEISGNLFDDNWSGVVLWENADRFCGSPNNTSNGYCTKVGGASLTTCVAGSINVAPSFSDCRWKTQNVWVHDNDFALDKAAIGCTVTTSSCGLQGLFSNYGTSPAWSPYKARVIQDAITFHQGNRFSANRYVGDWRFAIYEPGRNVDLTTWQGAPYGQDGGSTLNGSMTTATTTTIGPDAVPPSMPLDVTASAASSARVNLEWAPSSDNVGVTGYQVSRNGVAIGTTGATSYADTKAAAGQTYTYTVLAYDAAHNHSSSSAPVTVTTPSVTTTIGPDAVPPSMPLDVTASAASSARVNLEWAPSSDNVGVTGYQVSRNGVAIGTTGATSYADTKAAAGQTYTYTVLAYDAAHNHSSSSAPVTVTTPSVTTTIGPDAVPPSMPLDVTASAASSARVNLEWAPSSDNVGVTGYQVSRNGVAIGTTGATSYADTKAAAGQTYTYTVLAYDAAHNHSSSSAPVTVTTPSR